MREVSGAPDIAAPAGFYYPGHVVQPEMDRVCLDRDCLYSEPLQDIGGGELRPPVLVRKPVRGLVRRAQDLFYGLQLQGVRHE